MSSAALNRGDLGEHVDAVAIVLHHPLDAAQQRAIANGLDRADERIGRDRLLVDRRPFGGVVDRRRDAVDVIQALPDIRQMALSSVSVVGNALRLRRFSPER